ncbi:hypothetical protein P7C70_g5699, partial [Phenoliferia sp. Uapishka_3]
MEPSLSFANVKPSLAPLPDIVPQPGVKNGRMSTGGQRPKPVARMSTGGPARLRRQGESSNAHLQAVDRPLTDLWLEAQRTVAMPPRQASHRLDADYAWPARAIGIHPAPSLGYSETEDLGPSTQKKMCFIDVEIMQYRSLLGLACSAAAYSDNFQKEATRKHLFDYLDWIHTWMMNGMEDREYLNVARRLEASRKRWELVRDTFTERFERGEWEATEPYTGGEETENYDIHAVALRMKASEIRRARKGPLEEEAEEVVVPDSEDECEQD